MVRGCRVALLLAATDWVALLESEEQTDAATSLCSYSDRWIFAARGPLVEWAGVGLGQVVLDGLVGVLAAVAAGIYVHVDD
jgi:hypothetical protein